MKKNKVVVAILLDKSGSMGVTRDQAISGYNELVGQTQEDSKDLDIRVCLVTFNSHVDEHLWLVPADQLIMAKPEDYVPNGGTAMRDAIGFVIQKLWETVDDPDVAFLIKVITDGETNEDVCYPDNRIAALREMVDACEATKRWTITYMLKGSGDKYLNKEKAKIMALSMGAKMGNMAFWDNSSAQNAMRGMTASCCREKQYYSAMKMGVKAVDTYMSDSPDMAADFVDENAVQMASAVTPPPVQSLGIVPDIVPPTPTSIGTAPVFSDLPGMPPKDEVVQSPLPPKSIDEVRKAAPKYALRQTGTKGSVFGTANRVEWK